MLLPLNIITTKWDEIWLVKTLSGSIFTDVRVRMWDVFGEYVEIVSCAKQCEDLRIITSDTSNFDANKFEIIERGENTQSSKENG
jgi:23S rRNA maturation mini-RNase III